MSDHSNPSDRAAGASADEAPPSLAGSLIPLEKSRFPRRSTTTVGQAAAVDPESTGSSGGLAGYLHALRRHWFLALSLGVLGGGSAASIAWFCATTTYTASALIHIASEEPKVIPNGETRTGFDIYKNTQMQLLTSDFVLIAALRKIPNLEVLTREEDPVRWLAKSLLVESPGNAEILRVSLTTPDKNDGATIVKEVVDAYKSEVVEKERMRRANRLTELDTIYTEKDTEMRNKWTELKKLAEQLGTGDAGALSLKQQFELQQLAEFRNEAIRLRNELQQKRGTFDAKVATIKARQEKPASAIDIENEANIDPIYIKLQEELSGLDDQFREAKSSVKENGNLGKSLSERYARMRKGLEDQMAARRKQLATRVKTVKSGDTESLVAEAKELQSQIALLTEQETQATKDFETQKKHTEVFGNSSIDVEMMRAENKELDKVLTALGDERQRLQVELNSQPRITVIQPASPPAAPDKTSRLQNTIVLGFLGMLAPIGLLLWRDVRGRRINSISDISRGLGLTVIGTVPRIGDSTLSRIRPDSRRQRQMQICLDHSIDGIAAKLFLRRDSQSARVVLVSSATHGEGKSTLSIQLAKRLARTGANTLLVDFDLRKPSLHHVFDAPRGPGVSEFLRGESELGPIIRKTDIENLSILTAGSPFMDSLGALSNGVTRSLFEKVRGDYEFVVVDGSPILPMVDALLTSQHVDCVVLSVRRDVSQAHRVQAACEQLSAFGVEEFVAVLTGSNEELFYYGEHEHVPQLPEQTIEPG